MLTVAIALLAAAAAPSPLAPDSTTSAVAAAPTAQERPAPAEAHPDHAPPHLGIDEGGLPFAETGTLRTTLDWSTFYAACDRPDLVETSDRHVVAKHWLLGGGLAALAASGALFYAGATEAAAAPRAAIFAGFLPFVLGSMLAPVGLTALIGGLVISPDLGSPEENRALAAKHNASRAATDSAADARAAGRPHDERQPPSGSTSAAANPEPKPTFTLAFAPLLTPQAQGATLSFSF